MINFNDVHKKVVALMKKELSSNDNLNHVVITTETENLENSSVKVVIDDSRYEKQNAFYFMVYVDVVIYFIESDKIIRNKIRDLLRCLFSQDFEVHDTDIVIDNIEIDVSDNMLVCNLNVSYLEKYKKEDDNENIEHLELKEGYYGT